MAGETPSGRRPRVLVTLPDRPHPADGGKRRRAAATLHGLAALDADVDVVVLMAGPAVEAPLPPGLAAATVLQIHAPTRPIALSLAATALRRVPWQVAVVPWGAIRTAMQPLTRQPYDLAWFGATDHAVSLRRSVRAARTVVDMDDVEIPKIKALLALPAGPGTGGRLDRVQRRIELPLWSSVQRRVRRMADAVVVCSELDRQRVGGGPRVLVVPNGFPAGPDPAVQRRDGPPTVLLVGTYSYPPNVDAAVYAATRVLPLLRAAVPDARLRLVGRDSENLPPELGSIDGVDVVGAVPVMADELAGAWVSLAPVRYGGGTRVKILEAFAYGVPVVSTSLACEGLDAVEGEHLLVGDEPADLAAACARLIAEPETAARLGAAGRALLSSRFTTDHVSRSIGDVLDRVWPGVPGRSPRAGSIGA